MEKQLAEGRCQFCNKILPKAAIGRHLQAHLKEKILTGKAGRSYLLKIIPNQSWGTASYFLYMWVDAKLTFEELDEYLRGIWLECCGHMSAFRLPRKLRPVINWDTEDIASEAEDLEEVEIISEYGEINMSCEVGWLLHKSLKLEYDYDFGSTTSLEVHVVAEYPIAGMPAGLKLLSRNEPLPIYCSACNIAIATQACTVCNYDGDGSFCAACARKHAKTCEDFAEYGKMKIVNSPRSGVCGYEGGYIDKARDGVYKIPADAVGFPAIGNTKK